MAKRYRRRTQKPQAEAAPESPAAPVDEPAEDDIEEYDDGEPETVPTIDTAELEPIPLPEPATANVVSPEGQPAPFEERPTAGEAWERAREIGRPVVSGFPEGVCLPPVEAPQGVTLSGITVPSSDPLAQALTAWGLREEHVLAIGGTEDEPTIMTRGGRKLRWPRDAHVKLTESERDGVIRGTKHLDTPWNRQLAKEKARAGK